ncbi:MAG: TonB-dependent receptor, partial [Opitutaceae bacterium]|nr:TonB-dependent receptor [Opitutaceae bacterium]
PIYLVARAAYARTIGRPNVGDVLSGITLPEVTDDASSYLIRVSNPGLEPWTADSYHVSLDSYHLKGGFGSIGVYQKNVFNFFADKTLPADEATLLAYGIPPSDVRDMLLTGNVEIRRKENIGDAKLTGLELSYRQDLFFLPSWLKKTQLWINYTHLKVSGDKAEDFTGFTPDAFSAGINYIRPRFSLRLSCAYQAETKKSRVNRTYTGAFTARAWPADTFDYQAAHTRWGVNAEYSFSKAFSLYLNCSDIFGDDLIIYRRAPGSPKYADKYQRRVAVSYVMIGAKGSF